MVIILKINNKKKDNNYKVFCVYHSKDSKRELKNLVNCSHISEAKRILSPKSITLLNYIIYFNQ